MISQAPYSFVILTYNEEIHIRRLLQSLHELNAPVFILDSGSTDNTIQIAQEFGATISTHHFESHPIQWENALRQFIITTPWTIGLDADHFLSKELYDQLKDFNDTGMYKDIDGIYFNRKNYFKGKWIRHGGYFPKYMLKMFRTGKAISSQAELLDHRFQVKGNTAIWERGYLIEENLKENAISFWIDKHNRYSDLVAYDEYQKSINKHTPVKVKRNSPDHIIARKKRIWRKLPLFMRPFAYFVYRYIIQMGFLDGRTGFLFHFLQAFWFRLVVDVKIVELRSKEHIDK